MPNKLKVKVLVAQSCLTLCDPVDCSPPGSSVHGDFPGKNIGVGCHALLQGIFPTQGSNPGLLHCRRILYRLSHQGSQKTQWVFPKLKVKWTDKIWKRGSFSKFLVGSKVDCNVRCQTPRTGALWQPGVMGWRESGKGVQEGGDTCMPTHVCLCHTFMLMYGKNHHNIVKQLSSN